MASSPINSGNMRHNLVCYEIQVNVKQTQYESDRPEELVPNNLLAVTIAEFHVANHQDSVEDNGQRDYPE